MSPSIGWSTWHHLRSPYGPLFTLATEGLAHLGLAGAMKRCVAKHTKKTKKG
jgi:hypothetical protein